MCTDCKLIQLLKTLFWIQANFTRASEIDLKHYSTAPRVTLHVLRVAERILENSQVSHPSNGRECSSVFKIGRNLILKIACQTHEPQKLHGLSWIRASDSCLLQEGPQLSFH